MCPWWNRIATAEPAALDCKDAGSAYLTIQHPKVWPMSGFIYYLLAFTESVASVFGVRSPYEQPRYVVVQNLGQDTEVRRYEPRLAIEATVDEPDRDKAASQAFGLLFGYIAGANQSSQKIAMTVPVRTASERIAMTTPVETASRDNRVTMRFFLPVAVARAGAPAPLDPHLHLAEVPASTIAARRYSGIANQAARDRNTAILMLVLANTQWKPDGRPYRLSYDPPFAIPFLRRNEIAIGVAN